MAQRLTKEEFIARARQVHGDKYDYSDSDYLNARTKVTIICPIHGKFQQTPDAHLAGKGCSKCKSFGKSTEDIIQELQAIHGNKYDFSDVEYKGRSKKVIVHCNICGHTWMPSAGSLLSGNGCPKCRSLNNSLRFRMSDHEFKERLAAINSNITPLNQYETAKSRIKCKCSICGYMWESSAGSLLAGTGCPKCSGNLKKTHDEFVREMNSISPSIEIIGKYINAKTKIDVKCKTCGYVWSIKANNLQQGQTCPQCANKHRNDEKRYTQSEFVKIMRDTNPNIRILGEYVNAHTRLKVKCLKCGNEWSPIPWDILRGTGCPRCSHTGTSFFEQFILRSLIKSLGKESVLSRDKTIIGKELDIVVPSMHVAIEPGSWFWHKDKIKEDLIKQTLCNKIGIKLITIYDSCPLNAPPFPNSIVYQEDFSVQENKLILRQLVIHLFSLIGIPDHFSDYDWAEIEKQAYLYSRKDSTEEFIKKVSKVNDTIILGEYTGYNNKVLCKCPKCGYEWNASPSHLLRGQSCPKCAGRQKLTQDEFEGRLKRINPNLTIIGNYINSATPIKTVCNTCGFIWFPRPANLLMGMGCPQCNRNAKKSTLEKFIQDLETKNPGYSVVGDYINRSTPVETKCEKCGYIWKTKPSHLLSGQGCPMCARSRNKDKR